MRYATVDGSRKHRYDFWKIDRGPYNHVTAASTSFGIVNSSVLTACFSFFVTFVS